jgi:asparagine synthase (glutamine-hydrolysing)
MCGISGLFLRDDRPVDPRVVTRMTRAIAHRGPDGEGVWTSGSIGLGHRRLAIRDLSAAGAQPMHDPSGRVIATFNGEIYNDIELRRELERDHGVVFASHCDAEIIPAGYAAWGERLFERLEGMFAVGIWDSRAGELVLARDAAGVKPLVVWQSAGTVAFASELKAVLQVPECPRRIEPRALHAFMAQGYVSPDATLLQEVDQLPPGTIRVYGRSHQRERRFWRPTRRPIIADMRAAVDAFLEIWPGVLQDMLVSDVGLGVLQSGGLDSSLIVAQLAASGVKVPLFTAGFAEASHDERPTARAVAAKTGMEHHAIHIDAQVDAEQMFRKVVHHFDGQLADSSAFAVYQLCAEVRRHVPVVLGGDGADEYFAGYTTYRATRWAEPLRSLTPRPVAARIGRLLLWMARTEERRLRPTSIAARFALGLSSGGSSSHPQWRRLLLEHLVDPLYGPAKDGQRSENPLRAYERAVADADGDLLDRCMLADQEHYLPADMLMKVDAMSMAHGLEVRVPFLDGRVRDLAATIDGSLLSPMRGLEKQVLRDALTRLLPDIKQTPKFGFNTPVAALLRTGLRALADRAFEREPDRLAPYFAPAAVRALWREHVGRKANHDYALWCLLTLFVWFEQLEAGAPEATAAA